MPPFGSTRAPVTRNDQENLPSGNAPRRQRAILFSPNWHLRRKAARIDAEINERVNDGSADERGDDNYQHFQAEGTHTGGPLQRGLSIKSGDSKKTRCDAGR
jgi:hypothetical protein